MSEIQACSPVRYIEGPGTLQFGLDRIEQVSLTTPIVLKLQLQSWTTELEPILLSEGSADLNSSFQIRFHWSSRENRLPMFRIKISSSTESLLIQLAPLILQPNQLMQAWMNFSNGEGRILCHARYIPSRSDIPLLVTIPINSSNQNGELHIHLHRARRLRKDGDSTLGYQVKFQMQSWNQIIESKIVQSINGNDPVWDQHVVVPVKQNDSTCPMLLVQVWSGQDLIGTNEIPVLPYVMTRGHIATAVFPFALDEKPRGKIELSFQFVPNNRPRTETRLQLRIIAATGLRSRSKWKNYIVDPVVKAQFVGQNEIVTTKYKRSWGDVVELPVPKTTRMLRLSVVDRNIARGSNVVGSVDYVVSESIDGHGGVCSPILPLMSVDQRQCGELEIELRTLPPSDTIEPVENSCGRLYVQVIETRDLPKCKSSAEFHLQLIEKGSEIRKTSSEGEIVVFPIRNEPTLVVRLIEAGHFEMNLDTVLKDSGKIHDLWHQLTPTGNMRLQCTYLPRLRGRIRINVIEIRRLRVPSTQDVFAKLGLIGSRQSFQTEVKETRTGSVFWDQSFSIEYCNDQDVEPPVLEIDIVNDNPVSNNVLGSCTVSLLGKIPPSTPNFDDRWYSFAAGEIRIAIGFTPLGLIPCKELEEESKFVHLSSLKKLFYSLDADGSDVISKDELRRAILHPETVVQHKVAADRLLELFNVQKCPESQMELEIDRLFSKIDINSDGVISFAEYCEFIQHIINSQPVICTNSTEFMKAKVNQLESTVLILKRVNSEMKMQLKAQEIRYPCSNLDLLEKLRQENEELKSKPESDDVEIRNKCIRLQEEKKSIQKLVDRLKFRCERLEQELETTKRQLFSYYSTVEANETELNYKEVALKKELVRQAEFLRRRAEKREKQHEASVTLQSKVRGRLERKRYIALSLHRHRAATRIQAIHRGRIGRAVSYEKMTAAIDLQRIIRGHIVRKRTTRQHLCACILQTATRSFLTRHKLKVQQVARETKAALVIQNCTRRYQCRREVAKENETKLWCAVKLQSAFRGILVRNEVASMEEAAIAIQSVYRGLVHRKSFYLLLNQEKGRVLEENAACTIQSWIRTCLEKTRWKATENRAALQIQRAVRVRHFKKSQAAQTIQKCYRSRIIAQAEDESLYNISDEDNSDESEDSSSCSSTESSD